jgi:hypothetical protein
MRFRMTAFGAALGLAALLPGPRAARADSPVKEQWIVTAAHATGAGGEQFISSFRIVNPNNATATVDLYYLAQSPLDSNHMALGDNSGVLKVTVTVGPNQTLGIDDIVASKFGNVAAAGGVRVVSNQTVSVLSQVLVANAKSSTGVPGTNGFAIPGQTLDQAVSKGDTAFIPYVSSSDASNTTGYRTNIFLLSTNPTIDSVVHVKLAKGDGTVIGERDYTLGKRSQTQINRIAANEFGYTTPDTNLTAIITIMSGGPVVTGASIIDNAISSQSYAPPTKLWLAQNGSYGLILSDGGYGFAGRLDIVTLSTGVTLPNFISAELIVDNCPAPDTVQLLYIQGATYPPFLNATWTKNADGSYAMTGSTTDQTTGAVVATYTGTIIDNLDGTIQGTIVYTRSSSASNCPSGFKSFPFTGSKGAPQNAP